MENLDASGIVFDNSGDGTPPSEFMLNVGFSIVADMNLKSLPIIAIKDSMVLVTRDEVFPQFPEQIKTRIAAFCISKSFPQLYMDKVFSLHRNVGVASSLHSRYGYISTVGHMILISIACKVLGDRSG